MLLFKRYYLFTPLAVLLEWLWTQVMESRIQFRFTKVRMSNLFEMNGLNFNTAIELSTLIFNLYI